MVFYNILTGAEKIKPVTLSKAIQCKPALAVIAAMVLLPAPLHAACTAPAGVEGQIIFNSDWKIMQYCDNTDWISMGGANSSAGLEDGDKGGVVVSGAGSQWTVKAAGSTGQIQFNATGNTLAASNALVWDDTNKRLGLGTASPAAQLSLLGPGHAALAGNANPYGLYLYRDTGIGVGYIDVLTGGSNNTNLHLRTYNAGTYQTVLYGQYTGNVGIGTTNPTKRLSVAGAANTGISINGTSGNTHLDLMEAGAVKTNFYWDIANQRTMLNSIGNNMVIGGNVGIGITPANPLDVGGSIRAQRYLSDASLVESVSGNYDPTKAVYRFSENRGWGYNAPDDAIYYAANERVPIVFRASGRVGIGTTDPQAALHVNGVTRVYSLEAANTDNHTKIYVSGYGGGKGYGILYQPFEDGSAVRPAWFLNAAGAVIGSISTTASATAYNTTSDYRLKENITPLEGALVRVSNLKPHRFNFKSDPARTVDGFIAHEVQAVAPYAVSGVKDEVDENGAPVYQQVDYAKITPLLAAAIQELTARLQTLEQENAALRARVDALTPAP